MTFKEYSGEGYADSPDAVYPLHARKSSDHWLDAPSGQHVGFAMHFPSLRWAGSEKIVTISRTQGLKIAELLFGSKK